MSIKPERVTDGIVRRDTETHKLAGRVSTKGKKAPKNKKEKKSNKKSNVTVVNSGADFYAKQREQFDYFNNQNPPLDKAFALDSTVIKTRAIEGLREIFVELELTIDYLPEFKALVVGRDDFKVVVGMAEMLLDFESGFRNFKVHAYLESNYDEAGNPKDNRLYHDFMLQEEKDNRSIMEEKRRLLNIISLESGIDDEYRKTLFALATPEELHDLVFLNQEESEGSNLVYKEGYDYRVW